MWLMGLVAPRHVESSQTRAPTRVPCIGRQILNHFATREAPGDTFFFYINLFIYSIFGCPGSSLLHAGSLSSCREWGPLAATARGPLTAAPPPAAEHGLQARGPQQPRHMGFSSCGSQSPEHRLSSCGARAQLLCGTWDPPGPGLEPVSPALAGGLPTTAPPGKPPRGYF